jgi:predicted hotdog family 3-hydroxylacyl-ACP dehydratase
VAIDKAGIATLIPHTGAMCLLDEVTSWDGTSVSAFTRTHRDEANPLRSGGQVSSWCAIEYAVQAMAVHGALAGAVSGRPRAGYLVSLREIVCLAPRLDGLEGDLFVEARQLMGDAGLVMYAFSLRIGDSEVLSGKATVMLDAEGGTR